mgnify:CR=1 FL=1
MIIISPVLRTPWTKPLHFFLSTAVLVITIKFLPVHFGMLVYHPILGLPRFLFIGTLWNINLNSDFSSRSWRPRKNSFLSFILFNSLCLSTSSSRTLSFVLFSRYAMRNMSTFWLHLFVSPPLSWLPILHTRTWASIDDVIFQFFEIFRSFPFLIMN